MYVSSFCKLMRINVFIFFQHGTRVIKEFKNTRVRVSPCGQFRQPIQRPCHTPFVLQSLRSLIEAKPLLEHLHQLSCAYTPQQNGVVERKNCHLVETARTLFLHHKVLNVSWGCYLSCLLFD